jgi:S-DNA-T family DNA segregation ATPase FtsK/SpoIIIE
MFWGLELVVAGRVSAFRSKAGCFPISVLVVAGALATLPVASNWPFHHGFGGILGDALSSLTTSIFSLFNHDRATFLAGLVLFATGFSTLIYSIGLEADELTRIFAVDRRRSARAAVTGMVQNWRERRAQQAAERRVAVPVEPTLDPVPPPAAHPARRAEPAATRVQPSLEDFDTHTSPVADEPPVDIELDIDDEDAELDGSLVPSRGADFDLNTDAASRAIAARFAPRNAIPPTKPVEEVTAPKPPGSTLLAGVQLRRHNDRQYRKPPLNLLKRPTASKLGPEYTQTVLRGNARLLEDVLADFGVKGEVRDIKPGPVVTLYELEPARGTKSSRVVGLADDIARSMSASAVRAAVVPGRNAIGIELPNVRRETVLLRELLESDAFRNTDARLPITLGKSIGGDPIITDLARMPHLLVAGTTGSGKSVGVNAMVLSLLYRLAPEDCRLLMIDPKMLELSVYNGIPHLLTPVVTDPQRAVAALNWAVTEMEERYKRMAKLAVRNIDVFNNRVRNAKKRGEMISRTVQTGFDKKTGQAVYEKQEMDFEPMPYIVIVVDEFADLMIVAGKEIEAAVQRLAQMARAAGIHLIMATQRPSVDVITGTIKANFPTRISFKVASKIDSRTILNEQGAEQLLGQGDMLYSTGSGSAMRVHGPFVSDEEVESIAQALREQGEPRYIDGITDIPANMEDREVGPRAGSSDDDLYDRAVAIVLRDRKASTSYIQRRLSIGYNRAADLIERMEREGVISPANHAGKREILASGAVDAA